MRCEKKKKEIDIASLILLKQIISVESAIWRVYTFFMNISCREN